MDALGFAFARAAKGRWIVEEVDVKGDGSSGGVRISDRETGRLAGTLRRVSRGFALFHPVPGLPQATLAAVLAVFGSFGCAHIRFGEPQLHTTTAPDGQQQVVAFSVPIEFGGDDTARAGRRTRVTGDPYDRPVPARPPFDVVLAVPLDRGLDAAFARLSPSNIADQRTLAAAISQEVGYAAADPHLLPQVYLAGREYAGAQDWLDDAIDQAERGDAEILDPPGDHDLEIFQRYLRGYALFVQSVAAQHTGRLQHRWADALREFDLSSAEQARLRELPFASHIVAAFRFAHLLSQAAQASLQGQPVPPTLAASIRESVGQLANAGIIDHDEPRRLEAAIRAWCLDANDQPTSAWVAESADGLKAIIAFDFARIFSIRGALPVETADRYVRAFRGAGAERP